MISAVGAAVCDGADEISECICSRLGVGGGWVVPRVGDVVGSCEQQHDIRLPMPGPMCPATG
jgi:hypothetical protein